MHIPQAHHFFVTCAYHPFTIFRKRLAVREVDDSSNGFSDAVYHLNTSTQRNSRRYWERNAYDRSRASLAHRLTGAFLGWQCRKCDLGLKYGWWYFREEMGRMGGEVARRSCVILGAQWDLERVGLYGVDAPRSILCTWVESRVCSNLIMVDRLKIFGDWACSSTRKRPHLPQVSRAERWWRSCDVSGCNVGLSLAPKILLPIQVLYCRTAVTRQ